MISKRNALAWIAAAAGALLVQLPSVAQDYPAKPIKYIVPYAAGGGADFLGRSMSKQLTSALGKEVFVDNRAGASGQIGLDILTASPPDGYTVFQLSNSTTTSFIFSGKPLDIDKRFTMIGGFSVSPLMVAVNPKVVDVKNMAELIDYVRRKPGADYTSSGPGGPSNISMEAFAKQQGLTMTHVPYKGIGPALLDVLAGRIGIIVVDGGAAKPHLQSGALRPIVVISSVRTSLAPDVPTAQELGYTAFVNDSINALAVPPGTPPAIIEHLKAALRKSVAGEQQTEVQRQSGTRYAFTDGAAMRDWLAQDFDRWTRLIRDTGLKPPE